MTERGVSGNALAHTVYCDKALISRLVNGKQQPSASMARLLDDALGAGGKLAAVARRGGTTGAQASMEEGETVSVPCQTSDGRIIFVDVPRRLLLRGAAAAALAAAVPAGSQPELNGEPAATRFAIARRVLRDSDNLFGPHQVIPPATRQVQAVSRAARQARGSDRQELLQVQAQFADLIGWLYQDSGDHQAAQYWLDRALEWSHHAGDDGSVAFILARKSQLAADMGDPAGAVAVAEAAMKRATPRTRVAAAAAVYAAHGHALAGERAPCERLYGQARTALSEAGDDDSPWAAFCDQAYVGVQHAHSLGVLGGHADAAAGFHAAISQLPPGYYRDHGVYTAREAVAYAGAGELEHAAGLGMRALSIGSDTLSARIFGELGTLDGILAARPAPAAAGHFRTAFASSVLRPA
jgi:tetratricopeptide (TPR) repeat protein